MRPKVFLVFGNACERRTSLFAFFVEFEQKQFADGHDFLRDSIGRSVGPRKCVHLKSCVRSYRFFFHPFFSASKSALSVAEGCLSSRFFSEVEAKSQELKANLCLVLSLLFLSFSTAGDIEPKRRQMPSLSRANRRMTGCCASIPTRSFTPAGRL